MAVIPGHVDPARAGVLDDSITQSQTRYSLRFSNLLNTPQGFKIHEQEQPVLLNRASKRCAKHVANQFRGIDWGLRRSSSPCFTNHSLALVAVLRLYSYAEPWKLLVPLFETKATWAPEEPPWSAL